MKGRTITGEAVEAVPGAHPQAARLGRRFIDNEDPVVAQAGGIRRIALVMREAFGGRIELIEAVARADPEPPGLVLAHVQDT